MLNSSRMYTLFGKGEFFSDGSVGKETDVGNLCMGKWLERRRQAMHLKGPQLCHSPATKGGPSQMLKRISQTSPPASTMFYV